MNLDFSRLMAQQQALLATLSRPLPSDAGDDPSSAIACRIGLLPHPQTQRGLRAYQANGHALAERALNAAFPVVAALIGAENMAGLARAFWQAHPPLCGDLAQWGDALPDFLQASPSLADAPYLADVARVEWSLHRAAGATDPGDLAEGLASLTRLCQDDPATFGLCLAPGTTLVASPYPVVSLVHAHGVALPHGDEPPDLTDVSQRLHAGMAETACVWRAGIRSRLCTVNDSEAVLLRSLLDGDNLLDAVEAACQAAAERKSAAPFDFASWLQRAVGDGRVLGVCARMPNPSGTASP